ncbi:aldose 1-epimerase [Streptomyces albidoflavus]
MSTEDVVRLAVGEAEVSVDAGNGGRLSSLRIGGVELLRQGAGFGSFPMVPWCGRVAEGRFRDGAETRQLPLNNPPHAIHGTGREVPWKVVRASATEAVLSYELGDPWPYPGRVTQTVTLEEGALTLFLGIEAYESSFPAQAGWHPWFLRDLGQGGEGVRLEFDAAWQEERGGDHLPTGRRTDPLPGPWDDCFGMPEGVDVTVLWPGELELKVTSREQWVVVYDEQAEAVCVEPQTGPPNGLNTAPRLVTPLDPLEASTTWSWRRLG